MKLTIPELKTKLKLKENWTFDLFYERRNTSLFNLLLNNKLFDETKIVPTLEDVHAWYNCGKTKETKEIIEKYFLTPKIFGRTIPFDRSIPNNNCYRFTWPIDTVLVIDRYYIRNGGETFSSLTFRATETKIPEFKKHKPRFWAKLYDVNNIHFEAL